MSQSTKHIIAKRNDKFRFRDETIPGHVLLTAGLSGHLAETKTEIHDLIAAVRDFDDFTEDNDP